MINREVTKFSYSKFKISKLSHPFYVG